MTDTQNDTDISCYKCDGHLNYPKKLTWVCDDCKTDNSLFVIMIREAMEKGKS